MFHGTCESEASTVFVFVLSIVRSDCDCCFLFSAFVAGVVVTVYCSSVFGCNLFVEDYFISNLCKRNHFDVCTMHRNSRAIKNTRPKELGLQVILYRI